MAQIPIKLSHYRPDIDGLRAIAIIMVVAYHGFPDWIHGGFIGVDIFFVISGYLITGVIFSHVLADDFSIVDFYSRRIRRIFPALVIVTFVTFIVGWFLLAPQPFESLGGNIAGGALFIQNFVLLRQIGYFDIEAAKKPLLHLWSLGIEEQYYLAWPLLLILFRRRQWSAEFLTIALAIASFCLGLAVFQKSPDFAFYLPFTRVWELLAGSAVSIFLLKTEAKTIAGQFRFWLARIDGYVPKFRSFVHECLAVIALAALIFVMLRHKPYTPYPGSAALISVLATAILILTPETAINRFFLSCRLMVFIGFISYPLYLWHFPLMAFSRIRAENGVTPGAMTVIIAISFGLAWLTYRFVEQPIRFGGDFVRIKIVGLVASMAGLGALGLSVIVAQGVPSRVPENLRKFVGVKKPPSEDWRAGRCMLLPEQGADSFSGCSSEGPHPILFLWGDSFSAALYPGLRYFSLADGYGISQYDASACPPFLGYQSALRPHCKPINDFVFKAIEEQHPDIVILHGKWQQYDLDGDLERGLGATLPKLKALNVKDIVLLGPMPVWSGDGLPEDVLDYYYQTGTLLPERTKFRSLDLSTRTLETRLRAQAEKFGVRFISPREVLCNNDGCLARIGDNGSELTAFDIGHLTIAGSIFVARRLRGELLKTQKNK